MANRRGRELPGIRSTESGRKVPEFKENWTDEQILRINGRAVRLFLEVTEGESLGQVVEGNVFTGILNMCGQVETVTVERGTELPTMHIPGER